MKTRRPIIDKGALEASVGTKVRYTSVRRVWLKKALSRLAWDAFYAGIFFALLHWVSIEAAAFYAFLTFMARTHTSHAHCLPKRPLVIQTGAKDYDLVKKAVREAMKDA